MRQIEAVLVTTLALGCAAGVAAAPSDAPVEAGSGVRIELVDAGIALTIPDGWTVSVDHRRADPPLGQPVPAPERWAVLSASDDSAVLNGCRLFRHEAAGVGLAEFVRALMAGQPSTVTPVWLEAGEALRIDLELGGAEVAQQYVLHSGGVFHQLACLKGEGPPEVRWLAIAESLETLPGQE